MTTVCWTSFKNVNDIVPGTWCDRWDGFVEQLQMWSARTRHPDPCGQMTKSEWNRAKERLRSWSPATYPPNVTRAKNNVSTVTMLTGDLDDVTEETVETLRERLKELGLRYVIYTTPGNDRCATGLTRRRVAVPLSTPIPGPEWEPFWAAGLAHLGIKEPADPKCKNADRLYFVPVKGALIESRDGAALDVEEILERIAIQEEAPAPKPVAIPAPSPSATTTDIFKRATKYVAKCQPAVSGENGHDQTFKVACKLAGAVRHNGLSETDGQRLLFDYSARCDPPWTEAELAHKWSDALKRDDLVPFIERPRVAPGPYAAPTPAPEAANVSNSESPAPAEIEPESEPANNVVDLGAARQAKQTKSQAILVILRDLPLRRTEKGQIVIVEGKSAVRLDGPDGVSRVRSIYGSKHGDAVGKVAVQDAIAALDKSNIPTLEADAKIEEAGGAPSQADALVEIAKTKCELFHDDQDIAYVSFVEKGHRETEKLRSKRFRSWLDREFFTTVKKTPGGQAKADAQAVLEGLALHDGKLEKVFVRVAETEAGIFIDLADAQRRIVHVTRDGWKVVTDSTVRFVRPQGMLPLPLPVVGGHIDELRPFLNLQDERHFVLVVLWMVAAMKPRGPFAILNFVAEHGAGKSSASRVVRGLVDPNVSPIRCAPRENRDLAIAAMHSQVLAYDNMSGVPLWMSDSLCRVATGGGFSGRSLYTDDEETIFQFVRPIILNGIDDIATRQDLADRCLLVKLPTIPKSKRKREKALDKAFAAVAPRILGALLTGLVGAVRDEDTVVFDELPRMADFAAFATAAEGALGWTSGTFKAAYEQNAKEALEVALEADPVAIAVKALMADRTNWSGTPTLLYHDLRSLVGEQVQRTQDWPKAANALSSRLRRAAPGLRELGIEVDVDRGEHARLLTIVRKTEVGKRSSSSSASSGNGVSPQNDGPDDPDGLFPGTFLDPSREEHPKANGHAPGETRVYE